MSRNDNQSNARTKNFATSALIVYATIKLTNAVSSFVRNTGRKIRVDREQKAKEAE